VDDFPQELTIQDWGTEEGKSPQAPTKAFTHGLLKRQSIKEAKLIDLTD